MSYESNPGEKDYKDSIDEKSNNDGNGHNPDDIMSHPCSDDDGEFEDTLDGITSFPGFDGDEKFYIPDTTSELKHEDQVDTSAIKYTHGDRFLSEDMIRNDAELAGYMIVDFDDYCRQRNIKLIEKYQHDNKEQVNKTSSPEQRAILAKIAFHLLDVVTILEFANRTPDNNVYEGAINEHLRKIAVFRKLINGESYNEADLNAAKLQIKDELKADYIGPGKEAARRSFLEAQNKIKDDYAQEKKTLDHNPNFKKK